MPDGSTSAVGGTVLTGLYGTLTIGADGTYAYALNNDNAAVQGLDVGSLPLQDVFSYTLADGAGATSVTTLSIGISGVNDTPVISVNQVAGDSSTAGLNKADAGLTIAGTLSGGGCRSRGNGGRDGVVGGRFGGHVGLPANNAALLAMLAVNTAPIQPDRPQGRSSGLSIRTQSIPRKRSASTTWRSVSSWCSPTRSG